MFLCSVFDGACSWTAHTLDYVSHLRPQALLPAARGALGRVQALLQL
jgi:hypothetical protein